MKKNESPKSLQNFRCLCASVHCQLITAICIDFFKDTGNLRSMGSQNSCNFHIDNVVTTKFAEYAENIILFTRLQASVDSCPEKFYFRKNTESATTQLV